MTVDAVNHHLAILVITSSSEDLDVFIAPCINAIPGMGNQHADNTCCQAASPCLTDAHPMRSRGLYMSGARSFGDKASIHPFRKDQSHVGRTRWESIYPYYPVDVGRIGV